MIIHKGIYTHIQIAMYIDTRQIKKKKKTAKQMKKQIIAYIIYIYIVADGAKI